MLEVSGSQEWTKSPTKHAKDGSYKVYVRVNDQNILANGVLLKVWGPKKRKQGTYLK